MTASRMDEALPSATGDLSLIDRYRLAGDAGAFIEFMEAQRPWLDRALYGWAAGDKDAVEDLRQETISAAFVAFRRYRGASSPRTYLWRLARNIAAGRIRSIRRRRDHEAKVYRLHVVASESAEAEADPAAAILRRAEASQVKRALSRLPPDARALLLLRAGAMSYEAIARLLGISCGAARVRAARARNRFRRAFVEAEDGQD